ncbi:hypothetical protein AAG906_000702 [Vitis piasezkii]
MIKGGKKFYITFIDDYSRYTRVYLLRNKNEVKNQLSPKTFDAMFIGYVENSVAYRFLVTKSENSLVDVNTIIETKNADFFEKIFPMKLNDEQQVQKTSRDESIEPSEFEPRRSKRDRKETNLRDGFYTFLIYEDPKSYKEAITSPDASFWKEAINSEIESIMCNHTWELVDLPHGEMTISCRLSQYTQSSNHDHWTTVRRVLKYLRGTINYDDIKSTSGYVFTLGGSAVSWKSTKQTCITRSIMEVEFIALEKTSSEVEWLINLLVDIPLWTIPTTFVFMRCDDQAAIAKAKSKIFNGKNRHIRLRHNIVRQLLETWIIFLEFVRSKLNLVDPLTKPLNKKLVEETLRGMGLMPITEVKSGGNPTY